MSTAPLRAKPDFIIIGTQKAGTTSMYNYLMQHPQGEYALSKELYYFDVNFDKSETWYRSHFPFKPTLWLKAALQRRPIFSGEATPRYMFNPHVPKRIAAYDPNIKLIVLLRNPVDRAYSHYNHVKRRGYETLSFEDAIDQEFVRTQDDLKQWMQNEWLDSLSLRWFTYCKRGLYADQLKGWFEYFPRNQMLILNSDDLYASLDSTMRQAFEFVGMKPMRLASKKNVNPGGYEKMKPETRQRLVEYFKPHNEALYELLGVDYGWE